MGDNDVISGQLVMAKTDKKKPPQLKEVVFDTKSGFTIDNRSITEYHVLEVICETHIAHRVVGPIVLLIHKLINMRFL